MFGKSIRLFKLLGFEVKIDFSWLIIAVLITWSLAQGLFPYYYESFSTATYWWMGVAGALGLFVSIVLHELSHSLAARKYGIPIRGITLFIFGGVAEMSQEPPNAKSELVMAIAGPIASLLIGAAFYSIHLGALNLIVSEPFHGVLQYLAAINVILAVFNMVPAFPLDGGRVLRAALWGWKNNLRWATRIASNIGSFFGLFLIVMGVFRFIFGDFIGGAWWFLIGMFLRKASEMSYQQLLVRKALEGETVARFMEENSVTVPPALTLDRLVEDYIYRYHFKMFPVMDETKLLGCVTSRSVKATPREEWSRRTVGEVAHACNADNTVAPHTDATQVLSMMNRTNNSRLMVVENGHLVGVIALKDLLKFLSLKIELDDLD